MSVANYLDKKGAHILAASIKAYWEEKNRKVDVWIEPRRKVKNPDSPVVQKVFYVRSNMINGQPPL